MSKELKKFILLFLFVFAIFTAAVLVSETVNYKHIINTYPKNSQTSALNAVQVTLPSQQVFDFQRSKVTTWLIRLFMSFVVPGLFLFSKLSLSIRNFASRKTKRWVLIVILYFIIYSIIEMLIYFPLDVYTGFFRMHQYGLSNQTFLQWFVETFKSFSVNTAMSAAFIWIPFIIIKKSPRRWWLYIALASIPYLFFNLYMQPVLIDPIFNQYNQIEDRELSSKIDKLLSKTSIRNCKVFEVDKSKETNQMNAYMTGVFNSKRIVLWDTTISYLNTDEVLCVTAHEMGHYLMGHVWKSIIIGGLGTAILLYFVYRMSNYILRGSKGRLGFYKLSDAAAFPLIILLINLMLFASAPVSNAYSRSLETEADRFELELTKNNFASATSTVKLHQQSLTMPEVGLVYMLWTYDHPTFKSRVDFANDYKPWAYGEPLKYQRFIKKNSQ